MKLLKEDIEGLLSKAKYIFRREYENLELNKLLNYWCFFEEKETLIQELTDETLEVILYSKYYWCSKCKDKYMELYGQDVGIEQQQYKIVEELEQRLNGNVDWELIQMVEEGKI